MSRDRKGPLQDSARTGASDTPGLHPPGWLPSALGRTASRVGIIGFPDGATRTPNGSRHPDQKAER